MQIVNATSTLKRRTIVRMPDNTTAEARITRIGDRQLSRDGRAWAMVYATTDDGTEVAFACADDGRPGWSTIAPATQKHA